MPFAAVFFDVAMKLLLFVWISIKSYRHFVVPKPEPFEMTLIRLTSLVGTLVNAAVAAWPPIFPPSAWQFVASLAVTLASAALFGASLRQTRLAGLKVAFSDSPVPSVIEGGPYAYVRHPFYVAYMLYWWSWFVLTAHFLAATVALVLTLQYARAILTEERLLDTRFGEQYRRYKARTRCLIPWLF